MMNIKGDLFLVEFLNRRLPEEIPSAFTKNKRVEALVGGAEASSECKQATWLEGRFVNVRGFAPS